MERVNQPLTNAQLEILKVFSFNLNTQELVEFRKMIAQFFANRAIREANKIWDERKWDEDVASDMLNTKMRKSKK